MSALTWLRVLVLRYLQKDEFRVLTAIEQVISDAFQRLVHLVSPIRDFLRCAADEEPRAGAEKADSTHRQAQAQRGAPSACRAAQTQIGVSR